MNSKPDSNNYSITNTVIANNGNSNSPNGCGVWYGVCLLAVPSSGPRVFVNNTVVAQVGVVCDVAYPFSGSIFTGDPNFVAGSSACGLSPCCGAGNLNIDPATYHLMAGSSCIGKVAPGMSTAYDIDGQPRPLTTVSDCGADEYLP